MPFLGRTIIDSAAVVDAVSAARARALADQPVLAQDFRSFSVFRIVFALFLIADFYLLETPYFEDFRGETGILPLAVLREDFAGFRPITAVLCLLEAAGIARLMPVFFPAAAIAFAIGYRTRAANAILLALNSYIGLRNPYVMSGAEVLTRLLLLWGLFLPLNRYWSVDAACDPRPRNRPHPLLPLLALRVQIASLYVFAGLYKLATPAWVGGHGLAWSLQDNVFGGRAAGLFLVAYAAPLLYALNYLVIAFQLALPLLVYSPWRNDLSRAAALAIAALMHLSFILCLNVGGFPYVCLVMMLLLVPDHWINSRLFDPGARHAMTFLQKRWARHRKAIAARRWSSSGIAMRLLPIRSPPAPGKAAQAVCGVLAIVALATNISSVEPPAFGGAVAGTPPVRFAAQSPLWIAIAATDLLVWQNWPLFTPPPHWNRTFRIEAEDIKGRSFDIVSRQTPPIYRVTSNGRVVFANSRWLKLFSQLDILRDSDWVAFGRYLCGLAQREAQGSWVPTISFTTVTVPVPGTPSEGMPADQNRRFNCVEGDS